MSRARGPRLPPDFAPVARDPAPRGYRELGAQMWASPPPKDPEPPGWLIAFLAFRMWLSDRAAPFEVERTERARWLDGVAERHGVVRRPETLTLAQQERQQDWLDRRMGRKFYPTYPRPGFVLDQDGQLHPTPPL